jgi:hypothetical protein
MVMLHCPKLKNKEFLMHWHPPEKSHNHKVRVTQDTISL